MNIHQATRSYERWLGRRLVLVRPDLRSKHRQIARSAFKFLRGTFYRWAQIWREVIPDLARAPQLLTAADVHLENFGTWRDREGRLIWGINDFDEACRLPYTFDLIRLAASAHLAIAEEHLSLRPRWTSDAIVEGYREALDTGGLPFVLGEHHRWLTDIAVARLRQPAIFRKRIDAGRAFKGHVPRRIVRAAEEMLPARGLPYQRRQRVAGIGSLGHERLLLCAEWAGGQVWREAKALAPSACHWAANPTGERNEKILYEVILNRALRVPDPFVRPLDGWLLRRLAPDCSRIEIDSLPATRDEERLLTVMGWEIANIHLGSESVIAAVKKDLRKRPANAFHRAVKRMVRAVRRDWEDWRRG